MIRRNMWLWGEVDCAKSNESVAKLEIETHRKLQDQHLLDRKCHQPNETVITNKCNTPPVPHRLSPRGNFMFLIKLLAKEERDNFPPLPR